MISRVVNLPSGPIDGRMSSLQQARNPFALLAIMLVAALILPGARLPTTGESAPAIAFVNVDAIPMDSERVLENQTVLVVGDTIAAIGPANEIKLPADTKQIDARGRFLIPGLTEMHGHVPEGKTPIWQRNALFLYLANGVTTVRNMKGEDGHLPLRDKIDRGEILGPKLYIASPWLGWDNAEKPDQARKSVREYKAKGYDLLKVGEFPRDAYFAMAETAKEVGIPFGGHVPLRVSVIEAIDAGQVSIDHFDRYVEYLAPADRIGDRDHGLFGSGLVDLVDASRLDEAVSHTARAGVWNVPTLSLAENIANDVPAEEMAAWPEMAYAPEWLVNDWIEAKHDFHSWPTLRPENRRELLAIRRAIFTAMVKGGAPIAAGADAPQYFNVPGFAMHRELQYMVDYGMTPYQALASATRAPARYFGKVDEVGRIAPGMRADLVLLDANPLADIGNLDEIEGVMVRGIYLDRAMIDEQLAGIGHKPSGPRPLSVDMLIAPTGAVLALLGILAGFLGWRHYSCRSRASD